MKLPFANPMDKNGQPVEKNGQAVDTNAHAVVRSNALSPDAPRPEAGPSFASHEMRTPPRDPDDNVFRYRPGLADDVPLDQTPLAQNLAVLRELDALQTGNLHARWETEIRPAVRTAKRVREEEEAKIEDVNRRKAAQNARLETEIARVEAARTDALAPITEQIRLQDERLQVAHHEATDAATAAGGEYDPNNPDEKTVLRVEPRTRAALSAVMKLPFEEEGGEPPHRGGELVSHLATAGFGALFGVSFGLIIGTLRAGALLRTPLLLLVCLAVGAFWAFLSRKFIYEAAHKASERFYLDLPASHWAPFAVLTVAVVLATLVLDASVGRAGVLGLSHSRVPALLARYQQNEGGGIAAVVVALAFSLPYAGCAVWEGYQAGRRKPILHRILARQEQEVRLLDAQRRSLPEVQAALQKIARVRGELRRKEALEDQRQRVAGHYDAEIAALAEQKAPILARPDDAACQRIDQAILQARGLQDDWMKDLKETIRACSALPH